MAQINIAFGATKDWLKYTYVSICSILSNAKGEDSYKFYIMCDVEDENFEQTVYALNQIKKAEYSYILMNNSWFDGAIHDWLGVSSSYRLKLPGLVKEDKILYLDSDIVVLQDIGELYNYNIEDYYLGGVEDKCSVMMRGRVNLQEGEGPFINGGVLLMNLKKFREDDLETKIFKKLRESNFYTDQDVINDVCRHKILSLPLKYNLMYIDNQTLIYKNRREEFEDAVMMPVILHYTIKPWKKRVFCGEFWFQYKEIFEEKLGYSLIEN